MHEFKVGDWVIVNNGGIYKHYIYRIKEIIPESESFFEKYNLKGFKKYLQKEYLLPWQPKEGEWVCVDRYDDNLFTVCKFNSQFLASTDCEPFIGELPSFLQE